MSSSTDSEKSRFERMMEWAKQNQVLALLMFVGAAIGGVKGVVMAMKEIYDFLGWKAPGIISKDEAAQKALEKDANRFAYELGVYLAVRAINRQHYGIWPGMAVPANSPPSQIMFVSNRLNLELEIGGQVDAYWKRFEIAPTTLPWDGGSPQHGFIDTPVVGYIISTLNLKYPDSHALENFQENLLFAGCKAWLTWNGVPLNNDSYEFNWAAALYSYDSTHTICLSPRQLGLLQNDENKAKTLNHLPSAPAKP